MVNVVTAMNVKRNPEGESWEVAGQDMTIAKEMQSAVPLVQIAGKLPKTMAGFLHKNLRFWCKLDGFLWIQTTPLF
jgi:hypothetical protein